MYDLQQTTQNGRFHWIWQDESEGEAYSSLYLEMENNNKCYVINETCRKIILSILLIKIWLPEALINKSVTISQLCITPTIIVSYTWKCFTEPVWCVYNLALCSFACHAISYNYYRWKRDIRWWAAKFSHTETM